jgi:predicted ArsR family transcriptional regulator
MEYLSFILAAFLVFIIVYHRHENGERSTQARFEQKERRKTFIVEYLHHHPQVTNHDIRDLLHISHATATRYFEELEAEGRVQQMGGETGRDVCYQLHNTTPAQ